MNQVKNSPIIVIIIGVAAIAFAVYNYVNQNKFMENAVETTGTIIDIKEQYGSSSSSISVGKKNRSYKKNKKTYHPVVEFETKDGELLEFTAVSGSTSKDKYKVDDKIKILYNPETLTAQLKKANSQSTAYLSGGVGLLITLIGLGIMIFKKKKITV